MSININGLGNAKGGINTNSKQYKAVEERDWLSGIEVTGKGTSWQKLSSVFEECRQKMFDNTQR